MMVRNELDKPGVRGLTMMPRSASTSSTSRYDRPYRRYHRTAPRITSGRTWNPCETGPGWRHLNLTRAHRPTVPEPVIDQCNGSDYTVTIVAHKQLLR
jgi:hypothetical protein